MTDFSKYALAIPKILLPGEDCDLSKWAVVACDQYTSQPEYWRKVADYVGDAPSTLNAIYPEAFLPSDRGDARIASINRAMAEYEATVLTRAVDGFVLVERTVAAGARLGLMAAVDLEMYDYRPGSASFIRATEGTILDRIPPRVRIRKDAPLELPHVMLLANDPAQTLIEPIYASRASLEKLYDFELMMGGGHIRGWRVDEAMHEGMAAALEGLLQASDGLLFAVGDGNHSLAAARACWPELRESLSGAEQINHPARHALVELVNLHDPALRFEPIHRALFGADGPELVRALQSWLAARDMRLADCEAGDAMFTYIDPAARRPLRVEGLRGLPLAALQPFLDEYLEAHPSVRIDYVHGGEAMDSLVSAGGACGFLMGVLDKSALFGSVRTNGPLPRKAFSMGEAWEKRYYLECRKIR